MSNRFKQLVSEIQKTAKRLPKPETPAETSAGASAAPAPAPAPAGTSTPGRLPKPEEAKPGTKPDVKPGTKSVSSDVGNVKIAVSEMQKAIQNFASTAINYHFKRDSQTARQTPISLQNPSAGDQPSQGFANFNDFVTLNYLNSSPLHGNEWSTSEEANTPEQKNPVYDDQLIKMENVVDNIARIGGKGNERFVDGVWGPRTQNALRNLYAFGDAIIRVSEDFEAPDSVRNLFTKSDAAKMKILIPTNYELTKLPPKNKVAKAAGLTNLIIKLTKFYLYFANNVTKNPAYRRFTDSSSPLYESPGKPEAEKDLGDTSGYEDLMKDIDELYIPRLTILDASGTPKVIDQFPLTALTKQYVLLDMMSRWGGYQRNAISHDMQVRFLRHVMQQINERLSSGNLSGGQKLVQGPNDPFRSGGPLAPVPPGQLPPAGDGWEWAQKPDDRSWFRRKILRRQPTGK